MGLIPLAIYIMLILVRPMEWWEPIQNWQLVNAAAIVTLLLSFPDIMNEYQRVWRRTPEVRVAIMLLLGVTMSFLPSFYFTGMSTAFQVFGKVMVLYLLIVLYGRDQRNLRFLSWVFMLCIVWLAVHTVLLAQTGHGFGPAELRWREDRAAFQPRAYGIFADPNDLCVVLVVAVPLLYAELRAGANPLSKALALILIPLVGYAAWATHSRGGLVGLAGMAGSYAIARMKGRLRWITATLCIIALTVVLPRFFTIDVGRLNAWGEGIQMWKQGIRSMLFGVGFGNFPPNTEEYMAAHNSFIEPLAELGLVGYLPYCLLLYLTILHTLRFGQYKHLLTRQQRFRLAGYHSAAVGYLTTAYFLSRSYNHVLYIILALTLCESVVVSEQCNLYEPVFGPWRKDYKSGIKWALLSIPLIWISVRIGNLGR